MTQGKMIDDCFLHDRDRMRHDEALALLRERLTPVVSHETVNLSEALGRVLCEDITAPHDVPMHTNAAVDGYAFAHRDLGSEPLPIGGRIAAGDLDPAALERNTAVRIFTGAPMPDGADTVAMQEDCVVADGSVSVPKALKQGANCRKAGEDLQRRDLALSKGRRLRAADIATLASIGMAEIPIYRKLRVVCFSSGREMRRVGASSQPLRTGEVYDANWPLLSSLMVGLPIELKDGGVLDDEATGTEKAIRSAAIDADAILTTGGASRGDEDHMLTVLDRLGKRHLWQLAVKPGRPMMFGQISRPQEKNDCLFFGLPGNPVAAMVCFLLYTRPALLKLAGSEWETPVRFRLPADFEIKSKKPDRREFLRGKLVVKDNAETAIQKFPRDGSGLISSLRQSDGLIELPEELTSLEKGTLVDFIPFSSFD